MRMSEPKAFRRNRREGTSYGSVSNPPIRHGSALPHKKKTRCSLYRHDANRDSAHNFGNVDRPQD
ncbi:unnamed protein product [Nesidiocoris tenuis]|uniref:Uncharacterized protein n=1 Tax=Nesidiocoris tenuis TaxID=355587 RepID=A0A6H5H7B7_9HEMI|nr:unnamed protein product [Nesidiocoris tenuis]